MVRSKGRAVRVLLGFIAFLILEAFLMVAEAEYGDAAYVGIVFAVLVLLSIGPWRSHLRASWRRWLTDDYPPK
jgi:hypothetical protein